VSAQPAGRRAEQSAGQPAGIITEVDFIDRLKESPRQILPQFIGVGIPMGCSAGDYAEGGPEGQNENRIELARPFAPQRLNERAEEIIFGVFGNGVIKQEAADFLSAVEPSEYGELVGQPTQSLRAGVLLQFRFQLVTYPTPVRIKHDAWLSGRASRTSLRAALGRQAPLDLSCAGAISRTRLRQETEANWSG